MKEVITALKDTPIPTILVVAGIVFLLLAIAGQLAGRIVVAPERQRWVAVIGGGLLAIGVALYVIPQRPTGPSPTPPADNRPEGAPGQLQESARGGLQTKYGGVVANIARFAQTDDLIIVELAVLNNTAEGVRICAHARRAHLIDQTTGEKWRALLSGGELEECGRLGANQSRGVWMRFKIPNAAKRTFSLSSELFNSPIDNLLLGERP
jgi:hypothetical protein